VPTPGKYPPELRERAVALVASSGRPIAHIADELGINRETLRCWVRQAQADHGQRPELLATDEREELKRLRKEVAELRRANDILKAASAFSPRSSTRPGDGHDVHQRASCPLRGRAGPPGPGGCRVHLLRLAGPPAASQPARPDDQVLLGRIRAVHSRSGGTYGAPKVHAQLRREGVRVGRKRVERLLRAHGLKGAFMRKRWRSTTRQDPTATPAPDLVGRGFTAPAPNRLWVADISRLPTGQGPLWLASVRDAFSRRIVGWKASGRAGTELVLGALEYALWGRHGVGRDKLDPAQPRLVHHSDRGAQYTAVRFTQRLEDAGARPSMGSVGDSYDNALAENFFSTLKVELVYRTSFRTREEAEQALFRYIDGWYNPHRIQKALGWRSPDEYEQDYYRNLTAATAGSSK